MPAEKSNATPPAIPDFDLLRRIGRGSYGEVWLARSITGALRAVKIVHRDRFDSARPYDREFQGIQKYEPVSRSNEGLVHLLHVSRGEGFFYYVMELADNANTNAVTANPETAATPAEHEHTLAASELDRYAPRTVTSELKRHHRMPPSECLRIGLALTRGLEHLHGAGLVHRDIKPSNIIFVKGQPRLADIGLVSDADEPRTNVGTEGYLPPDGGGTPGADLFSLGKVLYEMSTGMDRQEFPIMPGDFAIWADREAVLELSEVIETACESRPEDRYQTAAAMRADLELLAAGRSVAGRRRRDRFWKTTGRAALALAAAAMFVAAGMWWSRDPAELGKSSTITQASAEWQAGTKAVEPGNPESLSNALARFEVATKLDPSFAPPLAGRAEALALLALHSGVAAELLWKEARAAADAALRLSPELASPRFTLGLVAMYHDFDWDAADGHFRDGLERDPDSSLGRQWYSALLGFTGQPHAALTEARRAAKLDPDSHPANANLALQLHFARQYQEAIAQYRRTFALTADSSAARSHLARLYLATERPHEGLIERLQALPHTSQGRALGRKLDDARNQFGTAGFWKHWLVHLGTNATATAMARAEAHLHLGEFDNCLEALRESFRRREPDILRLAIEPTFDALRTNSAFIALCRDLRLPPTAAQSAIDAAENALTFEDHAAGISPAEKAAGFRAIFDGETLTGWKSDSTNWIATNGALTLIAAGDQRAGHLRFVTQTVPDNFELRFEWLVEPGGNSGVNYRPGMVQYQVLDNALVKQGDRYWRIAGSLFGCIGHQSRDDTRPVGEWNEARIVCYSTTIEHYLNGRQQLRFNYLTPGLSNLLANLDREEKKYLGVSYGNVRARGGYLSLQDDGTAGASFRHLRWRKLE